MAQDVRPVRRTAFLVALQVTFQVVQDLPVLIALDGPGNLFGPLRLGRAAGQPSDEGGKGQLDSLLDLVYLAAHLLHCLIV